MSKATTTMEFTGKAQLNLALQSLKAQGRILSGAIVLPPVLIALAVFFFFWYSPTWYTDPFITLIFGLYAVGQIIVFIQIFPLMSENWKNKKIVLYLLSKKDDFDLNTMQRELLSFQGGNSQLKETISNWVEYGLKGELDQSGNFITAFANRHAIHTERVLAPHITIGRTILKCGFLGTLIGLSKTFPPMQSAIMSLSSGNEGQSTFITEIVKAIDGDAYAIATTLIATALSIVVEAVTTAVLSSTSNKTELVITHIADWYQLTFHTVVKNNSTVVNNEQAMWEAHIKAQKRFLEMQEALERNIGFITKTIEKAEGQIGSVAKIQHSVGERVGELAEFEAQYEDFIKAKEQSSMPYIFKRRKE